ncbi:MAG: CorA family divalent cation transporter [Eubacteriales bacterium]|nr:CorA family divalent cation transporter [Eubacteriales bacterium]
MYYLIENGEVVETDRARMLDDCPGFGYLTLQELQKYYRELGLPEGTVRECTGIQTRLRTSVDTYDDVSFGIINMLDLKDVLGARDRIGIYIKRNLFLLVKIVDEDDSVAALFRRAVERYEKNATLEKIVYAVMELLMQGSVEALGRIEERTIRLEEQLVEGDIVPQINREIFQMRNELTIQKHYYEQLIDIGEQLQQNANNVFENSDLRYLKIFADKARRLSDNTQLLNENLVHLREALNAALDYSLNKTMKLFTVVTTIFLPLTLIVGWYGMNFKNMPELSWKFGYAGVCILSVLVVAGCIVYFKKKKFM